MNRMRGQTTLDFAVGVSLFLVVVVAVFAFVPGALAPFETSAREETATVDRLATGLAGGMLGPAGEPYHLDRGCTVAFFESDPANDPAGDDGENADGDGVYAYPFGPDPGEPDPATFAGDCGFEDVGLNERLGLSPSTGVRIRLVADLDTGEADSPDADADEADDDPPSADDDARDTLCLDSNSNAIVEADLPSASGDRCDTTGGDDDVVFAVDGGSEPTGSVVSARRVVSIDGGLADGRTNAVLVVEVW